MNDLNFPTITGFGPSLAASGPITAFIGGGNMASALIGGLVESGTAGDRVLVIEPNADQRSALSARFGVVTIDKADAQLGRADVVVWAVKPQVFKEAALSCWQHTQRALHVSVAAGIRSDSIALWLGTEHIVRAMPNTPALIGQGISGLYARQSVADEDRLRVAALMKPTGAVTWVAQESDLDAVTAVSGSGPAYVFFFMEAMVTAAQNMGLSDAAARALVLQTFKGATELAQRSDQSLAELRAQVTSKGGTTFAAITSMEQDRVHIQIERALAAAKQRARELGDEFGS
jgi:pyrroline-5-carboxylate reductase